MNLNEISPLDIVRMLLNGTKDGMIKWEPESDEGDVFRANFNAGGVRLSRVVAFSNFVGSSGSLLLELLDKQGRSIFQVRPETSEDVPLVEELFALARRQAPNLDQTIGALLEEISSRTKKN